MLIYYFSFFIPLLPFLFRNRIIFYNLIFINLFFFIIFVGLRHETGGDWCVYRNLLETSPALSLSDFTNTFFKAENGFAFFLFVSSKLGIDVHGTNIIIAILLIFSLHRYLRTLPYYSLGFSVAVPHIIIILAMGFSQQAMAFSFCLLGINALREGKSLIFIILIFISSLFHLSSLIMIVLYFAVFKKSIESIIYFSIIFLLILFYFLVDLDPLIHMYHYYLGEKVHQHSKGAIFRVGLTLFFAVIYLIFIRKRIHNVFERRIYTILSYFGIILFISQFYGSTFADRLNYYVWPLQIYTIAQSIALLCRTQLIKFMLGLTIVILYCSLLSIWLFFGSAKKGWIPYRMYPLDTIVYADCTKV